MRSPRRNGHVSAGFRDRVVYCSAAGCVSCGGNVVKDTLKRVLKERGLEKEIEVLGTGCMGLCGEGPLVKIESDGHAVPDM